MAKRFPDEWAHRLSARADALFLSHARRAILCQCHCGQSVDTVGCRLAHRPATCAHNILPTRSLYPNHIDTQRVTRVRLVDRARLCCVRQLEGVRVLDIQHQTSKHALQ